MNGLKTARVVIIDDDQAEAVPLFEALSRLEIGCIWVRGNRKEDLPKSPLAGVRLVFLDMDLDIGGTSQKGKISATLNVLKSVVGENTTPLVVVIWTKHKEMAEEFEKQYRKAMPGAGPGLVQSMEKPASAEDIQADVILAEVNRLTTECSPLELLWYWEQLAHDAASETTGSLATVVTAAVNEAAPSTQDELKVAWRDRLRQIIKALVEASGGKRADIATALQNLVETLNAIHLDRLEHAVGRTAPGFPKDVIDTLATLSAKDRASINTMLQTAKAPDASPIRPGNLYLAQPAARLKCPITRLKIDQHQLVESCQPVFIGNKGYKDARKALLKTMSDEDAENSVALQAIRTEIIDKCGLIAVEVSPVCDFSQAKRPVSRFVAGLLVPDEYADVFLSKVNASPYLRAVRGINVPGREGVFHVLLNARFAFGIAAPEKCVKTNALLRLRAPVLVDLQAWLAAHLARPGYLAL